MKAYIGGTFDILHYGHIKLFRVAKAMFDEVVVCLNSDLFVERYKGKLPVIPYEQRVELLLELRSVDTVIPNYGGEDSTQSILLVKPDVIVAGSDWTRERLMKQMGLSEQFLLQNKITILIYPDSDPTHSSDIKKRMQ